MVPFELIPDDRWICKPDEHLLFKTKVIFLDGTDFEEQGLIYYPME